MNLHFSIGSFRNKGFIKKAFIGIFILFAFNVAAQKDSINYHISLSGIASTGTYAPFWLQNNSYGIVSDQPFSSTASASFYKEQNKPRNLFDYGFKANVLMQIDNKNTNLYFHELYAKVRFFVFDASIGSRQEIYGNQDSTLSGGSLLFSRNSRPMPKIYAGIERFTTLPYTFGMLEVKGGLSHGWFIDDVYVQNALMHHKYMYVRLGGKFPVRVQYGLDHVAQWGGNIPNPEYGLQPSGFSDFISIFLAGKGGSNAHVTDQINALGNHIISQSMKVEINISNFSINAYWQNISEDGPIRVLWNSMNRKDGLWGISVKNKDFPYVKKILYEYLNTTDQSGPYHDKDGIVYGGADTYLTNGVYLSGWTFFSRTIGTPFLTSPLYNTDGSFGIKNTRVQVHHFGIEGNIVGYNYRALSSFGKNYGNYSEPFNLKKSNSVLLEINKNIPTCWNIEVGFTAGMDWGEMYGNAFGGMLSIRKRGNLFNY